MSPTRISSGARDRRSPPPRPRIVSRIPWFARSLTIFIRWFFDRPWRSASSPTVTRRSALAAQYISTRNVKSVYSASRTGPLDAACRRLPHGSRRHNMSDTRILSDALRLTIIFASRAAMPSERSLDEAILEQLAEAVVFADRGGVNRRWNVAATAMFGFTAAEAIGQRLDLIIPEHLREAHWRGFDLA